MRTGNLGRWGGSTLVASMLAGGLSVGVPLAPLVSPASAHDPGEATLIGDVNAVGAGFRITDIEPVGADVYFAATNAARGEEVFFHDASAGTTVIVKDINPGAEGSDPRELTNVNGTLYFTAVHPDYGRELWRTDGTLAGTELVADVNPGPASGAPESLIVWQLDHLFFAAHDGTTNESTHPDGTELWHHVSATDTTTIAANSANATAVNDLEALSTRVFMRGVRVNADNGEELIRYTPGGGLNEYDLVSGSGTSSPRNLTAAGTTLFFSANTGSGGQLHRMKNGALAVPDPVEALAAYDPGWFTLSGGGTSVWLNATTVPDGNPTLFVVGSAAPLALPAADPSFIATEGSVAYFSSSTPAAGEELWAAAFPDAAMVADVVHGAVGSRPSYPMPLAGSLLAAYVIRDSLTEPVVIDTSNGSVTEFAELNGMMIDRDLVAPKPDGSGGWWLVASSSASGWGLWHLAADGSTVVEVSKPPAGNGGSDPAGFTAFGLGVTFRATDGESLPQMYFHFPPTGATTPVTGAPPWGNSTSPSSLAVTGDSIYWTAGRAALNAPGQTYLWAGNAIAGSAHVVSDTAGDPTYTEADGATAFGEGVLFRAATTGAGTEPWYSDGTQAGTVPLGDLYPGDDSDPVVFTALGALAVFAAEGPDGGGHDLWVTDGTPAGTTLLADTDTGFTGSVVIDGEAYLGSVRGVWVTDGTVAGTRRVQLHANPTIDPDVIVAAGGDRVYAGGSGELWLIDSANDTGTQIALPPGTNVDLRRSGWTGSRLVFAGSEAGQSYLYAAQGATVTQLDAAQLAPGFALATYALGVPLPTFAAHHEYVYFAAGSDEHGIELWRSDGTVAGTSRVTDVAAGGTSSRPAALSVIGDRLYFSADVPGIGREPHYIELTPTPPPPPDADAVIVPVEPARYWDTRAGEETFDHAHEATGRLAARTPYRLDIAGRGAVPGGAQAVAANIAVILPDGPGWATLYPCTPEVPKASHLNYVAGNVLANNAIVPLDGDGDVCLYATQAADFILDVNGYVTPGAPQVGIEPARYLDTRPGDDHTTFDGQMHGSAPIEAEGTVRVPIRGRGAVPSNATAAIVNVTAVTPDGNGYFALWPCTLPRPTTSTVNYTPGDIVPNGAVIDLSGDGEMCIFTKARADIVLDVTGYLTADMDTVHTLEPARLHDTRVGFPIIDGTATGPRLAAEQTIEITVAGRGGVPDDASAAFLNVAAVGTGGLGYVTLWSCVEPVSAQRPLASNVNYTPGMTRANNVLVKLSTEGTICAFTKADSDLIIDVTGWVD